MSSSSRPQQPAHRQSRSSQTIAGRMRSLAANISKPVVEIKIEREGQQSNYVDSFSTFDRISGEVQVTAANDVPFDDVEISFVGFTRTYVDKVATVAAVQGRSEAFHHFLKLSQPMVDSDYPIPRVLEAGRTHSFSFTFVVPNQLLPSICSHKTANSAVHDAHLALPPCLGDPEICGSGNNLLDDMAPEMSKVHYGVRCRVFRNRARDGKPMIVADRLKKIRIIPAIDEQPPLQFDDMDTEYCQRREKTLKKGIFRGKTGRLVMEAAQPPPFRLQHPHTKNPDPLTSLATVMLRFDPVDADSCPPRLGSLSAKLKVATYYATTPRKSFPTKASTLTDPMQGLYVDIINLSSRAMSSVQWQKVVPGEDPQFIRRGSTMSNASTSAPEPTELYTESLPYFVAEMLVPITLPTDKAWIPTFHSCIVSRIYVLELSQSVNSTSSGSGFSHSVSIKVPIQITAEGGDPILAEVAASTGRVGQQVDPHDVSPAPPRDEYEEHYSSGDDIDAALPPPPPEYPAEVTPRTGNAGGSGTGFNNVRAAMPSPGLRLEAMRALVR